MDQEIVSLIIKTLVNSVGFLIAFFLMRVVNELKEIRNKISSINVIVAQHRAEIGFVKQVITRMPCYRGACPIVEEKRDEQGFESADLQFTP